MQALKMDDSVIVVFTTVMDELSRGYIDEDEDAEAAPTDWAYWEKRGSKTTVGLADQLLTVVKEIDPSLEFKYNKFYIGLSKDGQPYNFVTFRPKKNQLNFELKLPQSGELDAKIEQAGIETLEYNKRWSLYRLRLTKEDSKTKGTLSQRTGPDRLRPPIFIMREWRFSRAPGLAVGAENSSPSTIKRSSPFILSSKDSRPEQRAETSCSKCRSFVSDSVIPSRRMVCIEMQSVRL